METLSALLAFCEGNPSITGRFLSQNASKVDFRFLCSKPKQAMEQALE